MVLQNYKISSKGDSLSPRTHVLFTACVEVFPQGEPANGTTHTQWCSGYLLKRMHSQHVTRKKKLNKKHGGGRFLRWNTCCNLLHFPAMIEGSQTVAAPSDDSALSLFHNNLTARSGSAVLVCDGLDNGEFLSFESARLVQPARCR